MCLALHAKYIKEYGSKQKPLQRQLHKNFPEIQWIKQKEQVNQSQFCTLHIDSEILTQSSHIIKINENKQNNQYLKNIQVPTSHT